MDDEEALEDFYEPAPRIGGYYFRPAEHELIDEYLKNKIDGLPLPSEFIKEIPFLYEYPPELLPISKFMHARHDDEAYYFTHKGKKPPKEFLGGKKFDGQWKKGSENACFGLNQILGYKTKLYFYRCEKKTGWVIKEYSFNPNRYPRQYLLENRVFHDLLLNYVVLKIKFNPDLREKFTEKESLSFSISMKEAEDLDVFQDFEG